VLLLYTLLTAFLARVFWCTLYCIVLFEEKRWVAVGLEVAVELIDWGSGLSFLEFVVYIYI